MQQFDVVVVGKGNAALCAALAARDKGATVAVLEAALKPNPAATAALQAALCASPMPASTIS